MNLESVLLVGLARKHGEVFSCFDTESRTGVVACGYPITPGKGRIQEGEGLLEIFRHEGCQGFQSLDGPFLIAVYEEKQEKLTLINDRMATLPLHLARFEEGIAFGPDGRTALRLAGLKPELDETGALEFLSMGYAIGSRTLFKGVELLPPASVLEIDLKTGKDSLREYWSLHFASQSRIKEADAAGQLFDTLRQNLRDALCGVQENRLLLLTGGHDSRTALALMQREKLLPQQSITWGIRDNIPVSDVSLAKEIAAHYNTPFQFRAYDIDRVADEAEKWTYVSELGSDNLGNFAAGVDFLSEGNPTFDLVINGDQLFGIGGIPLNRNHALETAAHLPARGLPKGLERISLANRKANIDVQIHDGLNQLCAQREGVSPKDLQDYLGLHLRIARWLNAPTYFRAPIVNTMRPLLHNASLDLFQQLPERMRVDKRLLLAMLNNHMPEVLQWPTATANSLVDWDYGFATHPTASKAFRKSLLSSALRDGALRNSLDWGAVDKVLAEFLENPPLPMSRIPSATSNVAKWRRMASQTTGGSMLISIAQRSFNVVSGRTVGAGSHKVLKRLALMGLFCEILEKGWFEKGHPFDRQLSFPAACWNTESN